MKLKLFLIFFLALAAHSFAQSDAKLRVFIRAGVKTHGPDQHDHPRFLSEWTKLLSDRGIEAEGSMEFPSDQQLGKTDVLVIFAADGMKILGEERGRFEKFLQRGGGLVVIHDGVVSGDEHDWAKKVQGGSWRWDGEKKTKWLETEVGIYFVDQQHPITKGISNFDWTDEIYYDMDMAPDAHVLATSFQSVFIIAPQLWTYEKTWDGGTAPYRAFVSLPGHEYRSFQTPHYRMILLRGIAWAGKRSNVDEFCKPEELASLTYPEGGPTAPEKAAERLSVHPEFTVNLVAAEPLVEKVISLDWGPDGKLWVAETPEYPNGRTINPNDRPIYPDRGVHPERYTAGKQDRPARDRISWLEDTNGDGRMDKKHVFADFEHGVSGGLELVTSLVLYKDGVIVAQAPDILWIRDTDGDGVADKVQKLYTGFGTSDTHAVINNFRWGLDGWVYGAVGYSAGHPKSEDGSKDFGRITAGILRFKPDGSALEQVASGSCNTWGFDFAPDGEMFYSTATCGEHLLHIVMPDKVLALGNVGGIRASAVLPDHQKVFPAVHHTRPAYVQIDLVGMFTAAAGCCIYNGGAWPERFNHMAFLQEPTVSLVHNDVLAPLGSTYSASKESGREETEFIAGSDLWFRPIHSRVGPDGALYVVDFYNQAAIHNDTRGPAHGANNAATRPDRDHHFARVWRIQHKQPKPIERPPLDPKAPATLVNALKSENGWTRDTAARLLRENGAGGETSTLTGLVQNGTVNPYTRIAALYTLAALNDLEGDVLLELHKDKDPIVRKNALRVGAERDNSAYTADADGLRTLLDDPDPRVRLNALIATGTCNLSPEVAQVLVAAWPKLADKYQQSATVAIASKEPSLFVDAAFAAADPARLVDFVGHVARVTANKQDAEAAARLVTIAASKPASTDSLKQVALETLASTLKPEVAPAWTPALQSAFKELLKSTSPGLPGAALPLIARWDKNGSLAADLRPVISQLTAKLNDSTLPDDLRGQIAVNLLGVWKMDPSILSTVSGLLGTSASSSLQRRVTQALGASADPAAGAALVAALPKLDPELRELDFGQLIKRADWAETLVQALADKKVDTLSLGPANLYRLRTYSDKTVSAHANQVIDALRGPEEKEKDALIVKLRPEVEKTGNAENGKALFAANCAVCHRFKNEGADFAPNLTGMGAHGAGELLIHILDPNRLVEPNFVAVSIETKDDFTYDGIVLRENSAAVVIRNQTGEFEVRKDNIKSRRSTGRSLMPEGFEALGATGLRDLLTYICADELRFRILDLRSAFTANTSKGIYNSEASREESLRFKKTGTIKVGEVPFDIVSPQRSPTGNNVLVLKGGAGISRSYPQKVEVKVGMPCSKLHFLGGIGGWAYPWGGEANKNLPVAKVTLHFSGGGSEEMILKNGVEFADYISKNDVPGSTEVPDLCQNGRQVRWFSKPVKGQAPVEKLTIESFNNAVAPTFIALTAESPSNGSKAVAALSLSVATDGSINSPPAAPEFEWGAGLKTLIIGGGTSHDFNRFFNLADSATLKATGKASVNYTETTFGLGPIIPKLDVLYISNNKPFGDDATRAAILAHANAGKGLLLVHPGLWYNWEKDWPEYNRLLCGGGSRGHDRYGEFEVTVTDPNHPLMKGVPSKFTLSDELYWFEPDPTGTPIRVLATAHSKQKDRTFPMVFVVEHPKARIAAIALGHDAKAHDHPAYKTLLQNSLQWVGRLD